MKKLLLNVLGLALGCSLNAQNNQQTGLPPEKIEQVRNLKGRGCGTIVPPKEWNEQFNRQVEQFTRDCAAGRVNVTSYTIPIIVHIIHGGQQVGFWPNISQSQVNSQIGVLNADYSGTGVGVNNLAATGFSAVGAANCNISFCLATKNASGQTLPEPGIDRVDYTVMGWSNPASFGTTSAFQNYINTVVKPNTIWDPSMFLNVWLTDENVNSVGLLGFATFPAGALLSGLPGNGMGTATTDGVWCWSGCWGNTGQVTSPYNLGRTASHEIGHYLGLRHIGGDGQPNGTGQSQVGGDCTATDYCADTPPQLGGFASGQYGQNYGGPTYPLHTNTCTPNDPYGDMFMNFMDYCDDAYIYMFTPNQRTRMQTALSSGQYRTQLSASSATQCSNPAAAPSVTVDMATSVCDSVAVITASSMVVGNPIPTYTWSSSPAAGVSFSPNTNSSSVTVTFPSAGIYTITCTASNSVGSTPAAKTVTVNACSVGIEQYSMLASYISLQPNPSSGKVNLITNLPSAGNIDVNIFNSLGQIIYNTGQKSVAASVIGIDLSAQPAGIYFVAISNGAEKVVKRLILTK